MKLNSKLGNPKFDVNAVRKILQTENKFIENLFSSLPILALQGQFSDDENEVGTKTNVHKFNVRNENTRAQSLTELQDRLQNIKSKKNLNYRDKLMKQGLQNRLKKKTKKGDRSANKKLVRMQKLNKSEVKPETKTEENGITKATKPVFNKEGKMVFSKFDFSGLGAQKEKRGEKDPKKILKNLENQKVKFAELEAKGEKDKVTQIKQKQAWKNALAKSEGEKVKDDPILLKKSIKKREQIRKGSEKKWQNRKEGVEKAQDMRQAKRNENIDKRKKEKKHKKMKHAVKRGRVIPGF